MDDWLPEQLKSLSNHCEVALLLVKENREDLIYSILEDLFVEAQVILDDYCRKD